MMCEHEWITTRAVYRESVVDGYKNHEINRRVCINCLKTQDEIDLENQLAVANARIAEVTNRLESAEKVCWSLFTDCCEWQVDVDALKAWREKYEKQYLAEYETKAALEEK